MEEMFRESTGNWASPYKNSALEVALETVSREVGTADERNGAVDNEQFCVHGGAWLACHAGPEESSNGNARQRIPVVVELGVVSSSFQQRGYLNTTAGRVCQGRANGDTRKGGVTDEEDLSLRLGDEIGEYRQGKPTPGPR